MLNAVTGLGTGDLYSRRWRAFWFTVVVNGAWLLLGALFDEGGHHSNHPKERLIGLLGRTGLALITAIGAGWATKKGRQAGSQT